MRWLGKILMLWAPGFLEARACREMSADFTGLLVKALREAGDNSLEAFQGAAREAGRRAARRLKKQLRLGESFEDAELAWRLVCKFSGMKIALTRRPGRSLFRHKKCPVLAAGGTSMCRSFCMPFVEGLTEVMCPSCRAEVVEEAAGKSPCTKALVGTGGEDAG